MARSISLLGALWMLAASTTCGAADSYPESSVKAAFLLRFAQYVEWPAQPAGNFVIAVLGRNDMASQLQQLATRPLLGRPVQVKTIRSAEEARGAHVLYVGNDRRRNLRSVFRALPEGGLLVVSDEENGLASGSTINFLLADGRVRFEVSLDAARQAGLKVSSELLSVAARVTE